MVLHPETCDEEVGGDGEAVTVLVSAGESLGNGKPTRTLQDRLNQHLIRGQTHKVPVHKRRLPPPPQDRAMIKNKALE